MDQALAIGQRGCLPSYSRSSSCWPVESGHLAGSSCRRDWLFARGERGREIRTLPEETRHVRAYDLGLRCRQRGEAIVVVGAEDLGVLWQRRAQLGDSGKPLVDARDQLRDRRERCVAGERAQDQHAAHQARQRRGRVWVECAQ